MGVTRPPLPTDGFLIIDRDWVRDPALSWRAKGLLAYLCSHAEHFRVSQNLMLRAATDGRDSLLSGLAELERAGYLSRSGEKQRGPGGRYVEDDYTITDPHTVPGSPITPGPNQSGGPTSAGNPHRSTHGGSPERKESKTGNQEGTPTESRGGQLAIVPDPPEDPVKDLSRRATALVNEHHKATNGMTNRLAVLGVIKRTLDVAEGGASATRTGTPALYTDAQVSKALATLRAGGRPITLQTMAATLDGNGHRPVGRPNYGPHQPYQDPPRDTPNGFTERF